jgi:uncharacterized protein YkwD
MKKRLLLVILLFVLTFNLNTYNKSYANQNMNTDLNSKEKDNSIEYINSIRKQMGIPILNSNDILNKMSDNHSKYMFYNNIYSSIEESGKLYYRGRYPWDRALYYSYSKPYITEHICKTNKNYKDGILKYIDNPYSRIGLLDPIYNEIGMGNHENYYTYNLGGSSRQDSYKVIYPYNGQKNISTNWTNEYLVNPYEGMELKPEENGYPITITYYSEKDKIKDIKINSIKIVNENDEKEIQYKVKTSKADVNLNNSIIILPIGKYDYNTKYKVSIDLDMITSESNKVEFNYEGTFYTEEQIGKNQFNTHVTKELIDEKVNRGEFTEELVKTLKYKLDKETTVKFKDIDLNMENKEYIYTAYNNNLIKGYDDNTFRPREYITKEQAYVIFIRAYENKLKKIDLMEKDKGLEIKDKDKISSWALTSMYKASKLKILSLDENKLNPKDYITKSELKTMIEKYNNLIIK